MVVKNYVSMDDVRRVVTTGEGYDVHSGLCFIYWIELMFIVPGETLYRFVYNLLS